MDLRISPRFRSLLALEKFWGISSCFVYTFFFKFQTWIAQKERDSIFKLVKLGHGRKGRKGTSTCMSASAQGVKEEMQIPGSLNSGKIHLNKFGYTISNLCKTNYVNVFHQVQACRSGTLVVTSFFGHVGREFYSLFILFSNNDIMIVKSVIITRVPHQTFRVTWHLVNLAKFLLPWISDCFKAAIDRWVPKEEQQKQPRLCYVTSRHIR